MNAAGILQDFQTLITNAGLAHFIDGEPGQYAKLTMSVVQDFRFDWSSLNPVVLYKIYNIPASFPLVIFVQQLRCHSGDHMRR